MRVAVDLDDVIADLITCMLSVHYKITGQKLNREELKSWNDFPEEVHNHVRYGDSYAHLTLLPGAREFLNWLKESHQVFIITYRGKHTRSTTINWLEQHVPGLYDEVHFTGGGKVERCRKLGIELIIDDSYNQIPAVTSELGIPGILIDTPMNRHIKESELIWRAESLEEAKDIIVYIEDNVLNSSDCKAP